MQLNGTGTGCGIYMHLAAWAVTLLLASRMNSRCQCQCWEDITSAACSMCQEWPEQIRRFCENVSKRVTSTETRFFRDRGKGRGRGGGGRLYTYRYTVITKMSPVLWWAAMRAVLMFHNCEGQSQDSVHRPQLLKRKESRSKFELRSLCSPV